MGGVFWITPRGKNHETDYGLQMIASKKDTQYTSNLSIAILVVVLLVSCSPLSTLDPLPTVLVPTSSLPPWDGDSLVFTDGKYSRSEACGRLFDTNQTVYGPLTIGIETNLNTPQDSKGLASKVITLYRNLYTESPIPLSRSTIVYIISNPDIGRCYSKGNLVFASPDELATRFFLEELLGAGTGISEYWVLYGLASLIAGDEPDQELLSTWYGNTDDLDIAGLFFAYFQEDWASAEEIQIAEMSATSLLKYALYTERISAEHLVEQVNNNVRTLWLASLGLHRKVTYPYDGRFTRFIYYRKGDCSLNIAAGNMRYCLNRLSEQEYFDEISEVEFFLNQTYFGRKAIEEYLFSEAPSIRDLMDRDETIYYLVKEMEPGDRRALGFVNGNNITINREALYYYPLHELVHTFNWNTNLDKYSAMLSEGFAEYLGKLLPIYPQTEKHCIFQDLTGKVHGIDTIVPGKSFCYYLDPEQLAVAKQWYIAQGGRIDDEEVISPRLFVDAVSFATIYRKAYGGSRGVPIGEKYAQIKFDSQDGLELSYTQASSYVSWLIDTYTLDRVLDVYVNGAEDRFLEGKTYEELKSAWIADLISKAGGITIPK